MIRRTFTLFLTIALVSCGANKKKTIHREPRKITVAASKAPSNKGIETTIESEPLSKTATGKASQIISTALTYSGTRYKFGGTTKKGMDCSGLIHIAFGEHNIQLPRASYKIAEEGQIISLENVSKGDLLFFGTSKRKNAINHVGLVVQVDGDEIKFIHSTSSRGVIVSSMREGYWNHAFIKATRIL